MKKSDFGLTRWIPIFIIAVVLMLIYKTIDNIGQITSAIGNFLSVISPLLYGILFTYFLHVPHNALERLFKKAKWKFFAKRARGIATIIVFTVLIALIAFILSFVLPIVFQNAIHFAESVPGYITTILEFFDNLPEDSIWVNFDIANVIRNSSGDFLHTLVNPDQIGQVAQGVMDFVGGIFNIIMGLVISLYLILDRDRITAFFKRLNHAIFKNESRANKAIKYVAQINKVLLTFIASKGLDSLINFVVATTVLYIFNVPYALLLGLIAGAFNFIPFLGSIISAFIISIITLITCDLWTAIYVMLCLLVFHQLDGNFIEPRIMKSSLKISPILVIITVVIGGAYFGIVGMFLAVPIAVIIKQILLEYVAHTEEEKLAKENAGEADAINEEAPVSETDASAIAESVVQTDNTEQ